MGEREPWPRSEFVGVGSPEMPMAERVLHNRANVMAIRDARHAVPSAMVDTLDAAEIETWIRSSDETTARLANAISHSRKSGNSRDRCSEELSATLGCAHLGLGVQALNPSALGPNHANHRPMDYRGLDLNLLVSLEVLLTERHVTRSAEKLGITQPAMSASLARLRTLFGDQLLVRSPHGLARTPRAELLLEQVGQLMAIVERITALPAESDLRTSRRTFTCRRLQLSALVLANSGVSCSD